MNNLWFFYFYTVYCRKRYKKLEYYDDYWIKHIQTQRSILEIIHEMKFWKTFWIKMRVFHDSHCEESVGIFHTKQRFFTRLYDVTKYFQDKITKYDMKFCVSEIVYIVLFIQLSYRPTICTPHLRWRLMIILV